MKSEQFQKHNRSERGLSFLPLVLGLGVIVFMLMSSLSMYLNQKKSFILRETRAESGRSVVDAVVAQAIVELRQKYNDVNPNQIDYLLQPDSAIFRQTAPRIYGKGEFQIDLVNSNGTVTSLFLAPESDPRVWIEPSVGGGYYRLNVQFEICKRNVAGRTKFVAPATGQDVAWVPACPNSDRQNVFHRVFLNTTSTAFSG